MVTTHWQEYDYSNPPEKKRDLWYYFEYVGVHQGRYYGDWCFAGEKGFLTGDVTHWCYVSDCPAKPDRPAGFKEPYTV